MKRIICIAFGIGVVLSGCYRTEGTLKIRGRVIDDLTKTQIPGREIIVQGLVESNDKLVPIDAGQFSTDSSGYFRYSLKKVKNARHYNFYIVGDSDYASLTNKLSLFQIKDNAKHLFFSQRKLANLTIIIRKISKSSWCDTIYLSWESDNTDFRTLYPYKIDNYGITGTSLGFMPGSGLRWIGGNINSTIKTRVFADKMTLMHWELVRNKRRQEFRDTIICKRNITNFKYFTY